MTGFLRQALAEGGREETGLYPSYKPLGATAGGLLISMA
jgi:hypothetical protein